MQSHRLRRLSRRAGLVVCALLVHALSLAACDSGPCPGRADCTPIPTGPNEPAGPIYRLQAGVYSPQPGSARLDPATTCPIVQQQHIEVTRRVTQNLQTGTITIWSSDRPDAVPLAEGPILWNAGRLAYAFGALDDGTCQFSSQRRANVGLIGDNTFALDYSEDRSKFRQSAGSGSPPCLQKLDCQIVFSVTLTMPVQ